MLTPLQSVQSSSYYLHQPHSLKYFWFCCSLHRPGSSFPYSDLPSPTRQPTFLSPSSPSHELGDHLALSNFVTVERLRVVRGPFSQYPLTASPSSLLFTFNRAFLILYLMFPCDYIEVMHLDEDTAQVVVCPSQVIAMSLYSSLVMLILLTP